MIKNVRTDNLVTITMPPMPPEKSSKGETQAVETPVPAEPTTKALTEGTMQEEMKMEDQEKVDEMVCAEGREKPVIQIHFDHTYVYLYISA